MIERQTILIEFRFKAGQSKPSIKWLLARDPARPPRYALVTTATTIRGAQLKVKRLLRGKCREILFTFDPLLERRPEIVKL